VDDKSLQFLGNRGLESLGMSLGHLRTDVNRGQTMLVRRHTQIERNDIGRCRISEESLMQVANRSFADKIDFNVGAVWIAGSP